MIDIDAVLAAYRELRRLVARERQRLERTGERKTQRYLRRTRLPLTHFAAAERS